MDTEAFSMEAFDARFVHCPVCQLTHGWATDEADLADVNDPEEARTRIRRLTVPAVLDLGHRAQRCGNPSGACGPVKLGYLCQNVWCRARFLVVQAPGSL